MSSEISGKVIRLTDLNDAVTVGVGDYTIDAQSGNHSITIGAGNSSVSTGDGNSTITTGAGDSSVRTGDGNNVITTGAGAGTINARAGNNSITTGAGNSIVYAGNGNNSITIGTGESSVQSGDGNNNITTGAGDSTITTGNGDSTITTGAGHSTISALTGNNSITIGAGNSSISMGNGNNIITTGAGDSHITVGNGNSAITTGAGDGTIIAGNGNSTITMGAGNNSVYVAGGNNTVTTGAGHATITTGAGDDTIVSGAGDDVIDAGAGSDTVDAGGGNDVLIYVVADNAHSSVKSVDFYDGGTGVDTLRLVLTRAEWMSEAVQADVAHYLAFVAANTDSNGEANGATFTFSTFALTTVRIEKLAVTVDGVAIDPANHLLTLVDDTVTTSEKVASAAVDVLANDSVPGLVKSLSHTDPTHGSVAFAPTYSGTAAVASANFVYTPNKGYYDYLAVGESASDTFTYTVTDASGTVKTATVSVTITGTNDAPTITTALTHAIGVVIEDATTTPTLSSSGVIAFNDVDLIDTHTTSVTPSTSNKLGGTLTMGAVHEGATSPVDTVGWTYNVANSATQYLAAGQSATEKFTVTVSDGHGGTVDQAVEVTVAGTNDAPTIAASALNPLMHLSAAVAPVDKILFTENFDQTGLGGATGNHQLYTNLPVSYAANLTGWQAFGLHAFHEVERSPSNVAVMIYADNVALQTTHVAANVLGQSYQISFEIAPAVFGGADQSSTVNDKIDISILNSAGATIAEYQAGGGIMSAVSTFTPYTFNYVGNGSGDIHLSIKSANPGDNHFAGAIDNIAISTASQPAVHNINLLGGASDVDSGETATLHVANVTYTVDGLATGGNGTLAPSGLTLNGSLLTVDPSNAAFDALAQGEMRTIVSSYQVTDVHGATANQTQTIVITGINDIATISGTNTGAVTEDVVLSTSGVLAVSDADNGQAVFRPQSAAVGTYGSFSINAAGNWHYDLSNDAANVQSLAQSQHVADSFTVTSLDGTATRQVSVDILGTNDAPVAIDDAGSAIAAGSSSLNATGNVLNNDTDVDSARTSFSVTAVHAGGTEGAGTAGVLGSALAGAHGTLTLNADGNYSYAVNQGDAAVQALNFGATLTDTFNYTMQDGSLSDSAALAITIHGANHAPVAVNDDLSPSLPGLVAFYQFNDASNLGLDSSGHGNNLIVVGSGVSYTANGEYSGGLALGGQGYLSTANGQVPGGVPLGGQSYTISAWFEETGSPGALGIIGWGNYGTVNQVNALRLGTGGEALWNYWWGHDVGTGNASVYDHQFHNVAVTYDGTTRSMYFDGTLVASDQASGLNAQNANFAIGKTVGSEYFTGVLDNVAVFNTALTAAQVHTQLLGGNYLTNEDTAVAIAGATLLANDTDVDAGDAKVLVSVQAASHGAVSLTDGTVTFTPDLDYSGAASFSYTMRDAAGAQSTATASLKINPVNDAPIVATSDVSGAVTGLKIGGALQLADSGTIAFSDPDLNDIHSVSAVTPAAGALGTLTASVSTDTSSANGLGGVVTWSYSVADSQLSFLAAGTSQVESFSFNVLDNHGGSVATTVRVTATGALTVQDDAHDNTFAGSAVAEAFVFGPGSGKDTITGFTLAGANADHIVLNGIVGMTNFSQAMAATTQVGLNTVIHLSANDAITLVGVNAAQLVASDFLFG